MFDDIINGVVLIYVRDLTEEKENLIKKVIDKDFMNIQNSKGQIVEQTTDLKGGYAIKSLDNNLPSTLSFGATKNGIDGVVIAGHAGDFTGEEFSYGGNTIGEVTITTYSSSTTADAAFVETNSSFNVTDNIVSGDIIGGITIDLPVGTMILMYRQVSGFQSGKIISYNFASTVDGVTVTDTVLADYTHVGGDSGGPIYIRELNNLYSIIGNHRGDSLSTGHAIYSKYENIASELGITVKH